MQQVFCLTLPLIIVGIYGVKGGMSTGETFKVLVVDDDEQNLLLLKQILKKEPYLVEGVTSGVKAIDLLKNNVVDLILLDILMPEMDGLEVCRRLKSSDHTVKIPVIFITALRNANEVVQGFEAGAVDYITKPFNRQELTARVRTHLQLKNATDIISDQNLKLKREIEHRIQTEEKFQALSQSAFEAVLFVRKDKIIEVNQAAMQNFQYATEEFIKMPVSQITSKDHHKTLTEILEGNNAGPCEMVFFRKDGSLFYGQLKHQSFVYRNEHINVLAVSDITRLKQLENEVRNAITETEERERRRFAMDLHDGLGVLLSTLKIYVALLQKPQKTDEERDYLINEIKSNLNEAVASAKRIANNLTPSTLDHYGLIPALESFSQGVMRSGAINIHLSGNLKDKRPAKNIETNIYRICTELINNTLKHAEAKNVYINIKALNGRVDLSFRDDGKGFDFHEALKSQNVGHGLKNILTRIQFLNGRLEAGKKGESGSSFRMEIPLY
ncbi:MAG TPA: response regulator [Bacteroidales bacterium]|nr:response regulator [Bacteroidales bacterium]